jgi:molecular chaperone DnaK (HSP70)
MDKNNKDISTDRKAKQKLMREVEKVKKSLSYVQEATIEIEDLFEGL